MIANSLLYQQLVEQFKDIGALVTPAELQGHLCGRHMVGHHIRGKTGLRIIADYVDLPLADLKPVEDSLHTLIEDWILVIDQDIFDFRLYLPDDDMALITRLDDLARWCEGFLNGLGATSDEHVAKIMQQESALLADLVEISKLDSNVEESEQNEQLYAEISEFVRLAAFNLFDRFKEPNQSQDQDAEDSGDLSQQSDSGEIH